MMTRRSPTWLKPLGLSVIALLCSTTGTANGADGPAVQIVQALPPGTGRVQSFLNFYCGRVPLDKEVSVKPYKADNLSIETANAFTEGLRGRNYRVAPSARYEVTMRARFEEGRYEDPQASLGSANVGNIRDDTQINLNVWSTTKDSLLTGRQSTGVKQAPQLRIRATLRDKESGRVQWRGEASGVLGNIDDEVVGRTLGRALADAFGCAVLVEKIPLKGE